MPINRIKKSVKPGVFLVGGLAGQLNKLAFHTNVKQSQLCHLFTNIHMLDNFQLNAIHSRNLSIKILKILEIWSIWMIFNQSYSMVTFLCVFNSSNALAHNGRKYWKGQLINRLNILWYWCLSK